MTVTITVYKDTVFNCHNSVCHYLTCYVCLHYIIYAIYFHEHQFVCFLHIGTMFTSCVLRGHI